MKFTRSVPVIILTLLAVSNLDASAQDICQSSLKVDYMSICEQIASIEPLVKATEIQSIDNTKSIYILSNPTYIIDHNEMVMREFDSFNMFIWFRKHLFFNRIEHWIELTFPTAIGDQFILKFRSFNSVDAIDKRSTVEGEAKFKCQVDGWQMVEVRIK